jgi:hypothetical protein
MPETQEALTITMSNTKKEMLAAYQDMKMALEKRDRELADAEAEKKTWREKAAEEAAVRAESDDPVRRLHDLRSDIGRQLTELARQFEGETEEYSRLKQAVEDRKSELQRIYEVETAAADLTALLEANRKRKEEFHAEMAEQRQKFAAEMEAEKATWARNKLEQEERRKDEKAAKERERKREQEEFEYDLKREREQRRNQLDDEMAALLREVATTRVEFEREQAEREGALAKREAAVADREKRVDELQHAVDAFPAELEEKVAEAVKTVSDRLNAEFTGREALLKTGFEGERNVLNGRIEALENLTENQEKAIQALTAQQEKAYEKVQDIASKAVASAGERHAGWPAPERQVRVSGEDRG